MSSKKSTKNFSSKKVNVKEEKVSSVTLPELNQNGVKFNDDGLTFNLKPKMKISEYRVYRLDNIDPDNIYLNDATQSFSNKTFGNYTTAAYYDKNEKKLVRFSATIPILEGCKIVHLSDNAFGTVDETLKVTLKRDNPRQNKILEILKRIGLRFQHIFCNYQPLLIGNGSFPKVKGVVNPTTPQVLVDKNIFSIRKIIYPLGIDKEDDSNFDGDAMEFIDFKYERSLIETDAHSVSFNIKVKRPPTKEQLENKEKEKKTPVTLFIYNKTKKEAKLAELYNKGLYLNGSAEITFDYITFDSNYHRASPKFEIRNFIIISTSKADRDVAKMINDTITEEERLLLEEMETNDNDDSDDGSNDEEAEDNDQDDEYNGDFE